MSMSPILQGLLTGLQSGLGAFGAQQQKAQDDARKQKQMQDAQDMEMKAWQAKQQWSQDNNAPTTRDVTIADPNNPGQNFVQHETWVPPERGTDPNLEKGQFVIDSTANDPNTMKLNQRSDESAAKAEQAQAKLESASAIASARNETNLARIEAANARGVSGAGKFERAGVMQYIPTGDPGVVTPVISDGKGGFTPYKDATGATPTGRRGAPTVFEQKTAAQKEQDAKDAAAEGKPGFFSRMFGGGDSDTPAPPLAQFSGPKAATTATKPASQFVEGKVYTDKNGNKAKYVDGQFVPI